MKCERCDSTSGAQAVAVIRSEILNLKVCGPCAQEASDLGLVVIALDQHLADPAPRLHAAA
jgi:protein-arginine kinase activator protein McsA